MKSSNLIYTVFTIILLLLVTSCNSNKVPTFKLNENLSIDNTDDIAEFLSNNIQNIIYLEFFNYDDSGYYQEEFYFDNSVQNERVYLVKKNDFTTCEGTLLSKSQEEIAKLCMDYTKRSMGNKRIGKLIEGLEQCDDFMSTSIPGVFGVHTLIIDNKEKTTYLSEGGEGGGWYFSGYFSVDKEYLDEMDDSKTFLLTAVPPVEIAKLK